MAENRCVITIVYLHHRIRLMASHKYRVSILVARFSTKSFFCCRESLIPDLLPQVGMEFSTIEEARMFWVTFGGQKGFEVRKKYANKRKSDEKVRSC